MSDKDKVIEAFKNSEEPLNAKKVSELSGVEKKEVDKIMKELKKDLFFYSIFFIFRLLDFFLKFIFFIFRLPYFFLKNTLLF